MCGIVYGWTDGGRAGERYQCGRLHAALALVGVEYLACVIDASWNESWVGLGLSGCTAGGREMGEGD